MFSIRILTLLDQIIKLFSLLAFKNSVVIFPNFLALILKKNQGVSLGILSDLNYKYVLYIQISASIIFAIVGLYCLLRRKVGQFKKYSIVFISAGALSNLIDRLAYGAIIDMIDISLLGVNLFTCNLADIYISLGLLLYLISSLARPKSAQEVIDKRQYSQKYNLRKEDGL